MLSGRVDAVPAFWNAEGVALKHRGLEVREFRVDDYGAPPYPEVVLIITSRKTLEQRRDRLGRALAAIEQGLRDTLVDPDPAARDVARAAETSDVGLVRALLDAVAPVFAEGFALDRDVLERWADFDARIGIGGRPSGIYRLGIREPDGPIGGRDRDAGLPAHLSLERSRERALAAAQGERPGSAIVEAVVILAADPYEQNGPIG
jgi:hypothetical protein